jgi:hypothetical protein
MLSLEAAMRAKSAFSEDVVERWASNVFLSYRLGFDHGD